MAEDFVSTALGEVSKNVGKAAKKVMEVGGKVAAAAAVNAIPTGKAASEVGKFVSRTTAGKMVAGEAKTVVRKFTQGKGAEIVEQAPKAIGEGAKSPMKGTKVTVVKETRAQTPLQQSTTTVGRYAREGTKQAGTYAKGAATAAIAKDAVDKPKGSQPDHHVTDSKNFTKKSK